MRSIDLHSHTTASDGTLSPDGLIAYAAERGVEVLAVTDHDTTAGIAAAAEAGERAGVRVVGGIEVSSRYGLRSVHVLGLFLDRLSSPLTEALRRYQADREVRARRMVEKLNELGYEITFEDVAAQSQGKVLARPHVARALVARGHVSSVRDAFSAELIADGGRADVPRPVPDPVNAVELIRSAGGVAVVAHPGVPHHHGEPSGVPEELLEQLAGAGLAGLEVFHPDHPPEITARLQTLAERLGLLVTGGSDCHGYEGAPPGTECTPAESFAELERLASAV